MMTITTVNDLRNWVDSAMGGEANAELIQGVTDMLQADDHPAWGTNWSKYLDGKDLWSMCRANEAAEEFIDKQSNRSQARETGYEAHEQGEPRTANPYAAGTYESKEWAAGWDEAAGE